MTWLLPMKYKLGPPMKHLPLSLSHLVVCWGSAMDFGVWFVGSWGFFLFSFVGVVVVILLWILDFDFAMDFGWVAKLMVGFDFAMNF